MLILILIDVQYLQNVIFSFEKDLNGQIHTSSDSHHWISPAKFPIPTHRWGIPHPTPEHYLETLSGCG